MIRTIVGAGIMAMDLVMGRWEAHWWHRLSFGHFGFRFIGVEDMIKMNIFKQNELYKK
jgi:hypothetical protein